jgi:ribonuclease E
MAKKMLIDATHAEETRVVVLSGNRLDEYDFETSTKKQIKGNIYLAKVTRVEPSLQACFIEFGGNRHGFLAFGEIHPDYWQIPIADREALLAEERRLAEREDNGDDDEAEPPPRRRRFEARTDISAESPEASEPFETSESFETSDSHGEAPAGGDQTAIGVTPSTSEMEAPAPFTVAAEPATGSSSDHEPAPGEASTAAPLAVDTPRVVAPEPSSADDASAMTGEGGTDIAATGGEETTRDDQDTAEHEHAPAPVKIESVGGDDAEDEEEEETRRRRFKPMRHYKIQEVIKRRQVLLVQVVKEERGTKGAALTTYISLAGRYCVLMPNTTRGGGISRRITSQQDRKRLKDIMRDLDVPDGMAVILRTAGMERAKPEIRRDYEYLMRLWDDVRELTLNSRAPALVYEEGSLIKRSIRDLYSRDIDEIQVEGRPGFDAARAFMKMLMPDHAEKIRLYDDAQVPLFQRHQVEAQLDEMHDNTVRLRSGGYIVLNQTEALVAIDVNSGRATRERHIEETALKTNLEAAEEVARQIRLRDLAGLIVIDFIDMEDNRHISQVERRLKEAMRSDRARIQIGRISPFGLLELSRQRLRPSLAEVSTQKCPHCGGSGFIRSTESTALRVLRGIEEEGIKARSVALKVTLPASVAIYMLNQKRSALAAIEQRYGIEITFEPDAAMVPPEYRIERLKIRERGETGPAPVRAGIDHAPEDIVEESVAEPVDALPLPSEPARRWERDEDGQDDGEAGSQEASGGEDGRGRGRRRRRRRGRGRGREDGMPGQGFDAGRQAAPGDGEAGSETSPVTGDAAAMPAVPAEPLQGGEGENLGAAAEMPGRAPRDGDTDDDGGRRRRRGRRGGRRRRGDEQPGGEQLAFAGPAADAPAPASAPAPVADLDGDLRMRARELYAQPDRFAPVPVASEPVAPAAEVHDWPWNRREEPAAPAAAAAPAPVVETVVEIVSAPAAPASEAPASEAPASEAPAPATPVAEAPVAEAPAAPAPMTEAPAAPAVAAEAPAAPAQDAPAVKQAGEAPAVEPLPVAEVVPEPEPKGPPRRGWWKRLTS